MSVIANFEIHYSQFLDGEGNITGDLPDFAKDRETMLSLYRFMTLTRHFDAKAIALQRVGKMGTFPSSLGQEAVSVAIGHSLNRDDILCPYYRDQGALFQRGVRPSQILSYWGGDERGSVFEENPEDPPMAVPIGTQVLHAAGVAYAVKLRKQKRAVLVTCGDGATSKGDFYQGISAAGVWKLPVVFVVNNNQWAISVPRSRQSGAQTLAQKAIAAGFIGVQVDGNDIIALCHELSLALTKARDGGGPTLLEAVSYRLCDHTTADDASRYVDGKELEDAKELEPLKRLKSYLTTQGFLTAEEDETISKECKTHVEEESNIYLSTESQSPTSIFDYLYQELPEGLREQRDELRSMLP
ncbi:MAG: pyruvate dehydrogenase (acetyl-transferring) E1 component subunit alpha [Spirochaetota bacterium]|nr:pyruvate dehydrogenase (acetyl-transferring) E1 component subunit alpha [Spirochaetota bacterium]